MKVILKKEMLTVLADWSDCIRSSNWNPVTKKIADAKIRRELKVLKEITKIIKRC